MRQQRTSQRRRTFDPSAIPQYPLIDWTPDSYGPYECQLTCSISADDMSTNGVTQLHAVTSDQYPVSMSVVGGNLILTYADVLQWNEVYELAAGDRAARTYFGGMLMPQRKQSAGPMAEVSWTPNAASVTQFQVVQLISGTPPYSLIGFPPFTANGGAYNAIGATLFGDELTMEMDGTMLMGYDFTLSAASFALVDAQGQPLASGTQILP